MNIEIGNLQRLLIPVRPIEETELLEKRVDGNKYGYRMAQDGIHTVEVTAVWLDGVDLEEAQRALEEKYPSIMDLRDAVVALVEHKCSCQAFNEDADDVPWCSHVADAFAFVAMDMAKDHGVDEEDIDPPELWAGDVNGLYMITDETPFQFDDKEEEDMPDLKLGDKIYGVTKDARNLYQRRMREVIWERHILPLANEILRDVEGEKFPFLLGATGMGKTTASQIVSGMIKEKHGYDVRYISLSGSAATTSLAIQGAFTEQFTMRGIVPEVWEYLYQLDPRDVPNMSREKLASLDYGNRAAVIMVDEVTMANVDMQSALLGLLQPFDGKLADMAGFYNIREDERYVMSAGPLAPKLALPLSRVFIIVGGNPWGNQINPALVRRTNVIRVDHIPESIINDRDLFSEKVSSIIRLIEGEVKKGLQIGVNLDTLSEMTGPNDQGPFRDLMERIRVVDQSAYVYLRSVIKFG